MSTAPPPAPPMSLLAELTHRCPLRCPYCSNPLALDPRGSELDTATWMRVLDEAAALGVLQVHFSGGEPMARPDLARLVVHANAIGLYSNLITSGVLMDAAALAALAAAGLDHVQLSLQDTEPAQAEQVGGMRGAHARKLRVIGLVTAEGIPLTLNFVIHRQNCDRVPAMLALAQASGAGRVEIAHTQYAGWGLLNRDALLPDRAQFDRVTEAVAAARARYGSSLAIDYVTPDYHAATPKPCMGGWGRRFVNVTPAGRVLPCHAAETIGGIEFPSVRDAGLRQIWEQSALFQRFRGTGWMPDPCRSCDLREVDWGGCRCQALALAGDAAATDPVCTRAPQRSAVEAALASRPEHPPVWQYRAFHAPDA